MKHLVKRIVLIVALCVMTMAAGYAKEPTKVGVKVNEIVEKYGETKGVECMTVTKGSGL